MSGGFGGIHICTAAAPWDRAACDRALHPDAICTAGPPGEFADWRCPHCDCAFRAERGPPARQHLPTGDTPRGGRQ